MFRSFDKATLVALILVISSPVYADGIDQYDAEMQRQMREFTNTSPRHVGYSFSAVFKRVKSALKVLTASTSKLNKEMDNIARPKKRHRGTLLIPRVHGGSSGGVSVAQ